MPFQEHSCLHDFLSFQSFLHTLPHRTEADVALADVQFDCVKPSPPWSTGLVAALGWGMVDGYLKSMWLVLRWVGTSNVAKQMQSSCRYSCSDWQLVGSAPYLHFIACYETLPVRGSIVYCSLSIRLLHQASNSGMEGHRKAVFDVKFPRDKCNLDATSRSMLHPHKFQTQNMT